MRSRTAAVGLLAAGTLLSTGGLGAGGAPAPAQPAAPPQAAAFSQGSGQQDPDQSLRVLGQRHDLRIGTAVDMAALAADAPYRERTATEFSTVTPENVMKWEALEPVRGQYDYRQADALVSFARQNRQLVRGHALVWHNQNPTWLTEGDFTPQELRQILRRHVIDTVTHFRGRIWHWDVVNEALNEDGTLRESIWLQKLGPGYIADAFRWAHQADPKAKLYYNDYSIEDVNPKSDGLYRLVKQLKAQGVPIHGVGVQAHHTVSYAPTSMRANLQRFDRLGLETAVTEADVRLPVPADNVELLAQAHVYDSMLQDCLLTRHCVSFTVWGFTDKYSWIPGFFEGQGAANLLDENFAAKPAYEAVRKTLALAAGPRRR